MIYYCIALIMRCGMLCFDPSTIVQRHIACIIYGIIYSVCYNNFMYHFSYHQFLLQLCNLILLITTLLVKALTCFCSFFSLHLCVPFQLLFNLLSTFILNRYAFSTNILQVIMSTRPVCCMASCSFLN